MTTHTVINFVLGKMYIKSIGRPGDCHVQGTYYRSALDDQRAAVAPTHACWADMVVSDFSRQSTLNNACTSCWAFSRFTWRWCSMRAHRRVLHSHLFRKLPDRLQVLIDDLTLYAGVRASALQAHTLRQ
jgi:hypothetical protein